MWLPSEGPDTPWMAAEAVPPERKEWPGLPMGTEKMQGVEGLVTSLVVTSAWKLPGHLDPELSPGKVRTRGLRTGPQDGVS